MHPAGSLGGGKVDNAGRGTPMRYRVLGPVTVERDGRAATPASARQRALLAALLLDANRTVSADRLIDTVWDTEPPATARTQLHICVSHLRKAGLGPAVRTVAPGYAIDVREGELDLEVSQSRVSAARAAAAAGDYAGAADEMRGALRLWTGDPLAGLRGPRMRAAAERLTERRTAMVEERLEYELRAGRPRLVADELAELTERYPLRERPQLLLMRALRDAGRRAEALDAYRSLYQRYSEELGIEPGAELRGLHQEILRGTARRPLLTRRVTRRAAPVRQLARKA